MALTGQESCGLCFFGIGVLLIVILIPLSYSGIEYHEVGLRKQRSTQKTFKDKVWTEGNHFIGPDYTFLRFEITAQNIELTDLSVWSANNGDVSAGTSLNLDVSLQYKLREDGILALYELVGTNYQRLIETRAVDSIKNNAPNFSLEQFLLDRRLIESEFMRNCSAVLDPLHADIVDFQLRRIRFPYEIKEPRLQAAIQQEQNDRELFVQEAAVVRSQTSVLRQLILNDASLTSDEASARASLIQKTAEAEATEMVEGARNEGLTIFFQALNMTEQRHKASMDELIRLDRKLSHSSTNTYLNFNDANAVGPLPS